MRCLRTELYQKHQLYCRVGNVSTEEADLEGEPLFIELLKFVKVILNARVILIEGYFQKNGGNDPLPINLQINLDVYMKMIRKIS